LTVELQGFEHHVHSKLVAELEAVGQGFLGAIDLDWNAVDQVLINSGGTRKLGELVYPSRAPCSCVSGYRIGGKCLEVIASWIRTNRCHLLTSDDRMSAVASKIKTDCEARVVGWPQLMLLRDRDGWFVLVPHVGTCVGV